MDHMKDMKVNGSMAIDISCLTSIAIPTPVLNHTPLVVQFVAESRFANCEFANLFFDFDELKFS